MSQIEIPKNGGEQIPLISPYNEYVHLTHEQLHVPLLELMDQKGVPLVASFCRTKRLSHIGRKLERGGWDKPLIDIHAARLVLRKADFSVAAEAIFKHWPTSEEIYPGLPSFRDYVDSDTRASFNPIADRRYRATHLNIHVPFGARIAEVQLYTVADYLFYIQTKDAYLQKQRG